MAPFVQLCNVWLTPTNRVPWRETRWNVQGCPKLANRSQPLVGRSSPYYEDVWRRYRLSIHALAAKIQADKVVRWCQIGNFFASCISASRLQHISDMHSKFALIKATPCVEVWQTSNLRPLRLGEERKRDRKKIERKKPQGKKYNGLPHYIGRP